MKIEVECHVVVDGKHFYHEDIIQLIHRNEPLRFNREWKYGDEVDGYIYVNLGFTSEVFEGVKGLNRALDFIRLHHDELS